MSKRNPVQPDELLQRWLSDPQRDTTKSGLRIVVRPHPVIEPLKLAFKQHQSLQKLLERRPTTANFLKDPALVSSFVSMFHPDFSFDQETRQLQLVNHQSKIWLEWESGNFNPKKYEVTSFRLFQYHAIAKGHDFTAYGPNDFRKLAYCVTVALCLYEFEKLQIAVDPFWVESVKELHISPTDEVPAQVWQHLYWCNRFFSAFQRISDFPAGKSEHFKSSTKAALLWRQAAWARYCEMSDQNPDVKIKQVVIDFVEKYPAGGVNFTDVHKWIQLRKKVFLGTPSPQGEASRSSGDLNSLWNQSDANKSNAAKPKRAASKTPRG
jgi:hypothetical protein